MSAGYQPQPAYGAYEPPPAGYGYQPQQPQQPYYPPPPQPGFQPGQPTVCQPMGGGYYPGQPVQPPPQTMNGTQTMIACETVPCAPYAPHYAASAAQIRKYY